MHVTESKLRYVIECREVSFGVSLHVYRILRHKLRETRQSWTPEQVELVRASERELRYLKYVLISKKSLVIRIGLFCAESNSLQLAATHCNSLQPTAAHCSSLQRYESELILALERKDAFYSPHSLLRCVAMCCKCVAVSCMMKSMHVSLTHIFSVNKGLFLFVILQFAKSARYGFWAQVRDEIEQISCIGPFSHT